MSSCEWWKKPRKISVVVDNDSWVLPYAQEVTDWCNRSGDTARLCRTHDEIQEGTVAFYLGCVKITPPDVLARNRRNLVVHASDLPKGRGFSPWTYDVLEGADKVAVCLIEAAAQVDAGNIIYKDWINLQGTELVDDLRALIGGKTVDLAQRFLNEREAPDGKAQEGEPTVYPRRKPADSRLDPEQSIVAQFDLLRITDYAAYPAFFEYRGKRYKLLIAHDEREKP